MDTASSNTATQATTNKRERKATQQLEELRVATNVMLKSGETQKAVVALLDVVAKLQQDNERLTFRLMAATRARFGRSSEKLNAEELGQLILAFGGTQEQAAQKDPEIPKPEAPVDEGESKKPSTKRRKRRRNHPGRTQLDPALPRVVTTISVPEEDRNCNHCGSKMESIGYVDHEVVEFVPAN